MIATAIILIGVAMGQPHLPAIATVITPLSPGMDQVGSRQRSLLKDIPISAAMGQTTALATAGIPCKVVASRLSRIIEQVLHLHRRSAVRTLTQMDTRGIPRHATAATPRRVVTRPFSQVIAQILHLQRSAVRIPDMGRIAQLGTAVIRRRMDMARIVSRHHRPRAAARKTQRSASRPRRRQGSGAPASILVAASRQNRQIVVGGSGD